jgi:hypothetical protein
VYHLSLGIHVSIIHHNGYIHKGLNYGKAGYLLSCAVVSHR